NAVPCVCVSQWIPEVKSCLAACMGKNNLCVCVCVCEGCLPVWDAVVCWPRAAVGETVHLLCPAVFSLFKNNTGVTHIHTIHIKLVHDSKLKLKMTESYFATVKLIYTVGYGASLLSLSVAVVILLLFRRLHCARNYIHMQLFFTFILKSVAVFVKDATLFSSEDTDHCTLSTVTLISLSLEPSGPVSLTLFPLANTDEVYLNSLDYVNLSYTGLWVFSRCWDINEDSPYWWIIKGPIVVSIGVNFLLFMNIIRILVQKLNPRLIQFNNSAQYRRLTKSTLLLIPLFGTHYMVFNFLPDYFNVSLRLCIELCLGSFQVIQPAISTTQLKHKHRTHKLIKAGIHYTYFAQIDVLTLVGKNQNQSADFQHLEFVNLVCDTQTNDSF
uniref:Growth hormone releasing hormone receptor n=1 Tax=Cyprinus carpio TaxID=7962 RepID=A0A8C2HXE8_CYPCA